MIIIRRLNAVLLSGCLLVACTGQEPAGLKNSSNQRDPIKAACSEMIFEGQVLSQRNMLNIFECSGWSKQYPDFTQALRQADQEVVDNTLKPLNDVLFSSKESRKDFFKIVQAAQADGQMDALSGFLEKSLSDKNALIVLDKIISNEVVSGAERQRLMQVFSKDNETNLRYLRAIKSVLVAFEKNKNQLNQLFEVEDRETLPRHLDNITLDFARNMSGTNWIQLGRILFDSDSILQEWSINGLRGDLRPLLNIIQQPTFYQDILITKNALDNGITCKNQFNSRDFKVDVKKELNHKIEGLKNASKEEFEGLILHGLTKYLAFYEFCDERYNPQGYGAFFNVIQYAFSVIPSDHDYVFLKRLHQVFGEDRYVFLSFLTSQSFLSLHDQISSFAKRGKDEEFVRLLNTILAEVPLRDLAVMADFIKQLGEEDSTQYLWFQSWARSWQKIPEKQRLDFINLLGLVTDETINSSSLLSLLEALLTRFPELSSELARNLSNDNYQQNLIELLKLGASADVQRDLSVFFSKKGLFEFVEIITRNNGPKISSLPSETLNTVTTEPRTYVQAPSYSLSSKQVRSCFDDLSRRYQLKTNYWGLVNELPEDCLASLGRIGMVGHIYLWMNSSNKLFKDIYKVEDFHSADGVWAPGMLHFLFTAAVDIDDRVKSDKGSAGILNNIDEIYRVLTEPRLLELFHQFSKLYPQVDTQLNLSERLLGFINKNSDEAMTSLVQNGFALMAPAPSYAKLENRRAKCSDLNSSLGANTCLKREEINEKLIEMLRILKRKNENNKSLIQEFVSWAHPQGGIPLKESRRSTKNYHVSIDELIGFLYDLSSESTKKSFTYKTGTGETKTQATVIDRLEVLLRDIGFTNNFFGAYFINSVARTKNFKKHVIKSEDLMVLLDRTGGLLRTTRGIPKDSKNLIKNVRAAYSSMLEVDDNYTQRNRTTRSYGLTLQSMLGAITASSPVKTQNFNPYRIPKGSVVDGHNGEFLTLFAELSGLRHLSVFVRERFGSNLSVLESPAFKQINSNLIARHSLTRLQNGLQELLDKYLDNDRNQLNLMLDDATLFLSGLSVEEQTLLEEIALKGLVLLSDPKISDQVFNDLAPLPELMVKMWPEIRQVLISINEPFKLLEWINTLMDSLVTKPQELNQLITILSKSNLLSVRDLENLIVSADLRKGAADLLNQLSLLNGFNSELNWHETFNSIISETTNWQPLRSWFQRGLGRDASKLTLSLLIQVLGEKDGEKYKLKLVLDELLYNHREDLALFLSETFQSMELQSR
jgi:hypothetical protein